MLDIFLKERGLEKEYPFMNKLNQRCINEDFCEVVMEKFDEAWAGNDNFFAKVMKNVNNVDNFDIGMYTMTLIRTSHAISGNIERFRDDFKVWKLFHIESTNMNQCYVIITTLKPYWTISSLNNFIDGTKKLRLFDGQKDGYFLWVGLFKPHSKIANLIAIFDIQKIFSWHKRFDLFAFDGF